MRFFTAFGITKNIKLPTFKTFSMFIEAINRLKATLKVSYNYKLCAHNNLKIRI